MRETSFTLSTDWKEVINRANVRVYRLGAGPLPWDASAVTPLPAIPPPACSTRSVSLRVSAVCGVDLEPRNEIVAVDGDTGTVTTLPVDREI